MKKEVTKKEYAFFCDICGKQISDVHDRYGRYQAASEIMRKCEICGRDVCPDCRTFLSSLAQQKGYETCSECQSVYSDKLDEIASNRNTFRSESSALREKYLKTESDILKSIRAMRGKVER